MESREAHLEHLNEKGQFLPSVSIDCVIFGFHDGQLKVLLVRFRNTGFWALPGGYVYLMEDMDEAAGRILQERTAVKEVYLEQFYAFGQRERVNRGVQQKIVEAIGLNISPDHWISKRFISVGYFALVDFSKVNPSPDGTADVCDWHSIDEVPELVFDHTYITRKALENLRKRLGSDLVGSSLLPETFTMQELQTLYEAILGKKLLRSNFHRKMLRLGILERVEKKFSGRAHKAPYLYRFELEKSDGVFLDKLL